MKIGVEIKKQRCI